MKKKELFVTKVYYQNADSNSVLCRSIFRDKKKRVVGMKFFGHDGTLCNVLIIKRMGPLLLYYNGLGDFLYSRFEFGNSTIYEDNNKIISKIIKIRNKMIIRKTYLQYPTKHTSEVVKIYPRYTENDYIFLSNHSRGILYNNFKPKWILDKNNDKIYYFEYDDKNRIDNIMVLTKSGNLKERMLFEYVENNECE